MNMAQVPEMKIKFRVEEEKTSWWQRLFKRKERPRNERTLYDFVKYIFDLHHESRAMIGYLRENYQSCDNLIRYPSKKIIKRYNISCRDSSFNFQWWLMEQYFEGNLVEKQKEEQK